MKSLTSKFVLSVLSLVLTGVALSVGVYAWFTINNTAEVQSFTTEVRAGAGFYVSLDGEVWTNTITTADLQALINADTFRFDNVYSPDGVTFKEMDGTTNASASNYIQFPLYFAGNANVDGVLLTGMTFTGSQTSWIPGMAVAGTRASNASTAIDDYASNAARVSIADQLTAASPTITVIEKAVGGAHDNSQGKGDFETNEAVLFYNAIEANPILEADFNAATLPSTITAAGTMNNVVAPLYSVAAATTAGWTPTLPPAILNVLGTDAEVAYVMVRVWIEGWDQEAFNAILSGTVQISFDFEGYQA